MVKHSAEEEDESEKSLDPTFVAADAAELHAKLIEARDAMENNHEGKAALLIDEAAEDAGELTQDIDSI